MGLGSLKDLYLDELGTLYDAEVQMIRTLPRLSEAAHTPELREALTNHCRESRLHIDRLELIFTHWGKLVPVRPSAGLAGIVQEADRRLNQEATPDARDAAIIAVAQRIEHYEIAAYGCARSYARRLNRPDEARLLQATLDDEGRADNRLAAIAEAFHVALDDDTPEPDAVSDRHPGWYNRRHVIHLLALAGVLSISFSAVFIRLARVSPVTATFYRAVYAIPVLAVIWLTSRARDDRTRRERLLAFVSGLFLAADLNLWHESIALVGAGLGTVIPNVQIVFVALVAWLRYGDRPHARTMVMIGVVLAGVVLTSGLAKSDAYGTRPVAGVALGVAAGLCYAIFLIVFRASNRGLVPPGGPLLDATVGTAAGALLCAGFDAEFMLAVSREAHLWLLVLALVSQVVGWLFIATALPRLPAIATSVMLLIQPVFAIAWGVLFFEERQSVLQWTGSAIRLAGVASLSMSGAAGADRPAGHGDRHR